MFYKVSLKKLWLDKFEPDKEIKYEKDLATKLEKQKNSEHREQR